MRVRSRLMVLSVAVVGGCVAWLYFQDTGITASIAFAAVYVLLISINVPFDEWIRVDNLNSVLEGSKNTATSLGIPCLVNPCPVNPCPGKGGVCHRHVHFSEVVEKVLTEKMCRAYGALKLSEKLIRDVRHDWERCIWGAIALLLIWGVVKYAKFGVDSSTSSATTAPVVATGFDWWKGALTALLGFYKLITSFDLLHWFRKQNASV